MGLWKVTWQGEICVSRWEDQIGHMGEWKEATLAQCRLMKKLVL